MNRFPNNVHLITHPISLIALVLVLVTLLAIFGVGWLTILLVLVAGGVGVIVIVKYPELRLENENLVKYLSAQFRGFQGEAYQVSSSSSSDRGVALRPEEDLDKRRVQEYENNLGLFLTHVWRPSEKPRQVADVVIRLSEHQDTSTRRSLMAEDKIECVRYELGRRFSEKPMTKNNKEESFALEISAYRPMLCLAEVIFKDGSPTLYLSRYIDFPDLTHSETKAEGV